ncbi:MAG: hypothetical protein K8U03_20160, partial [Planctomycetia bacterium]|nr:hypothetical protein [Planctomycetia bacterium]
MEQHEAKQQYEAKPLQFGLRTALLAVAGVSVWLAGMTNEHLRPWLSVVNFVLLGIVNHYAVDFVCRRVQAFAAGKYSAQFSGALTAVVGSVGALCWGTFLMLAVYDNYDLPFGFLLMSLTVAPVLFFSALVISCLSLIVLTDLTRRKYRDL